MITPVELILILTVGICFGCSIALLSSNYMWKKILGVALLGNVINLFLVITGYSFYDIQKSKLFAPFMSFSRPAFLSEGQTQGSLGMIDPISQALVLTAIVIGLAVLAILIVLYVLSYQQSKSELVEEQER